MAQRMALESEPPEIVTLRGERFYTWERVAFILKWYEDLIQTYRLPAEAEEEAQDILGKRALWQAEEEWRCRLRDIDNAWMELDSVNADWAIWLWDYYVLHLSIDKIARKRRTHFYKVQQGINQGVGLMVKYLNGEA